MMCLASAQMRLLQIVTTRIGRALLVAAVLACSVTVGGVVVGPDGNIWITENNANKIGRLSLS
jgi:streptogramin lyase